MESSNNSIKALNEYLDFVEIVHYSKLFDSKGLPNDGGPLFFIYYIKYIRDDNLLDFLRW